MRLPYITQAPSKRTSVIGQFGGLNQNIETADGEWAVMKNASDRFYPAVATRPARGAATQTITDPRALMYKNGMFYIDGTAAYYKGEQVMTLTDSEKQIVSIGAYICVFPDNVMYNTYDGTITHMVASYTQSSSITFAPLSEKSAYTKITAAGIDDVFDTNDNIKITGCTDDSYNATKIITTSGDGYIVVTGALDAEFTQESGLKFERLVPEMDFITEKDNRLWGCSSKNHEVYCCKQGDPKNWYNYESGADNAWAATVGSDGDFTGCYKYSSYVLFFKESVVHILRGTKPANFTLTAKELTGVRTGCGRSIQVIDDTMYYVGRNGVYAYDGAIPQKISSNITADITEAVSCQYNGKLYISCKLDGNQSLIVYDPRYRLWDVEDDTAFLYASFSQGELYFIDGNKELRTIYGTDDSLIRWYLESGDINENELNMKYVSKFKFNLWIEEGAEVTVLLKFDDEAIWHKKGHILSKKNKTYTIPVMPRRCGKYRFRLEGVGQMKLLAMSKEVEQGSELNVNLQH